MKKIIALLLAILTCAALVSCGKKNKEKNEIVGEWVTENEDFVIVFNKDGTGTDPDGGKISWKYKRSEGKYIVTFHTYDTELDVFIKTDRDGKDFITVRKKEYFRNQ